MSGTFLDEPSGGLKLCAFSECGERFEPRGWNHKYCEPKCRRREKSLRLGRGDVSKNGGARPGAGRPVGSKSLILGELRELVMDAQIHPKERDVLANIALARAAELVMNDNPKISVPMVRVLLEYTLGKPVAKVDVRQTSVSENKLVIEYVE